MVPVYEVERARREPLHSHAGSSRGPTCARPARRSSARWPRHSTPRTLAAGASRHRARRRAGQPGAPAYLTDFAWPSRPRPRTPSPAAGTIDYVPDIEGKAVDARGDCVGCLLYELLTGRVPYPRDSEVAKMARPSTTRRPRWPRRTRRPARASTKSSGAPWPRSPRTATPRRENLGRRAWAGSAGRGSAAPPEGATVLAGGAAPTGAAAAEPSVAAANAPPVVTVSSRAARGAAACSSWRHSWRQGCCCWRRAVGTKPSRAGSGRADPRGQLA